MIYSELKEQILSLGFENSDYLLDADQAKVFRDGINKALNFINVDFPIIGKYEVTLDGTGDDFDEIDFADFSDFDVLLNATIKKEVKGRKMILPFADFFVEQDTIVKVWQGNIGDITFFYRTRPTPVTTATLDATTITVHYKAEPLVALLASYSFLHLAAFSGSSSLKI